MNERYSSLECSIICQAWRAGEKAHEISERLLRDAGTHRTRSAVTGKITRMAISGRNRPVPSKDAWIAAAMRAASDANIPLHAVLGRSKTAKAVRARWQAWEELYGDGKTYSISGIAKRVGVDHSSIFYARSRAFKNDMFCGQGGKKRKPPHPNSLANLVRRRASFLVTEGVR